MFYRTVNRTRITLNLGEFRLGPNGIGSPELCREFSGSLRNDTVATIVFTSPPHFAVKSDMPTARVYNTVYVYNL